MKKISVSHLELEARLASAFEAEGHRVIESDSIRYAIVTGATDSEVTEISVDLTQIAKALEREFS